MKLTNIRTLEQLTTYKETWDHILEVNQNNNPFIEFQWVENWWRYLGGNRSIEVIVVEKNDNVIAFFPFQFSRKWNTTVVEFIGRGEANYMDIIVHNYEREETIKFVFDELMEKMPNCIFNLHGLLSSSHTTDMLNLYLAKRKCKPTIFSVVTPFIKMESIHQVDYMKKRRKLHGLDRREKRLRYLGEIKVETSDPREIKNVFDLHDKRWKQKLDTSHFTDEAHRAFYSALVNIKDGPMQAKLEGLYLDNQMIAFSYGFRCRGRYTVYVVGHDDDYGIYGPGSILDKELIGSSGTQSIKIFDLSIGFEPYKFEWNTGVDYTNNFMFSSSGWKLETKLMFQLIKSKGQIKATIKKNYKIVLFKREFIGQKLYFIKHAKFKDWFKLIRRLSGKIYSRKSINIYQQSHGDNEVADFKKLVYPEAKKKHYDVKQINKRYYRGFIPYSDPYMSMFWIHPKLIRVDEVDYLQPLPKYSAFIAEWQIHKLSSICSFLREDKKVKDIFLYTSKEDSIVRRHLKQLGFNYVKSIKKTCVFSKSTTQVLTDSSTKE